MLQQIPNYQYVPVKSDYNTTSGSGKALGLTLLDVTVLNITKRVLLSVIGTKTFNFDFILGLDYIPAFHFNLDHNLRISQSIPASINVTELSSDAIWNDYMTRQLFDDKVKHLSPTQRSIIHQFITRNVNAFA